MDKFIASQRSNTIRKDWCLTACQRCSDCKPESRNWSECWSACDECNRCHARTVRDDDYNDPYNYILVNRRLDNTPALAKRFCSNVCGVNMCKAYRQRYNGFTQCKRCQQQGKCWSQYQGRCVDCPREQALSSCAEKWGCPNRNGSQFGYGPPVDPMFTDCIPCWNPLTYTT